MGALFYVGVAITLVGLTGLGWCIVQALPLRGAAHDDDAAKRRLRSLLVWNAASFGLAFLGLGIGLVGLLLG